MKGKFLVLAAAFGMVLSGLSVSIAPKPVSAGAGPVTVNMFASPAGGVVNLDTNWFTKYVENKFNMRIKWVLAPTGSTDTKQSLLLASGDYPDIFWSADLTPSQELKYGHQGILVPINSYLTKYAPNVLKAMKTFPGLKRSMVAPDGKIYGIPAVNYCWHCDFSEKMWIDTRYLKQLHLKMPTTTAQFAQVLEAFKKKNPKFIPLDGSSTGWNSNPVDFLMNAFIYNDGSTYFYIQNGKLVFAPIQAQWKEGLTYVHSLFTHGLIAPTVFTQNDDQLKSQLGQLKVFAVPWGCINCVINYGAPGSDWQYWRTVPPLKGPHGFRTTGFYGTGPTNAAFAITNKAKPAEIAAVMKLVNFIFTLQGTTMLDFGAEGKYWSWVPKGKGKGLTGDPAVFRVNWQKFYSGGQMQNDGWNQMGPMYQSEAWRNGAVAEPISSPNGDETMLQDETSKNYSGHQPKYVYPAADWIPSSDIQQYGMLQTNINNFVLQWVGQFVTGTKDINKDWNTYVQGVKNLGLQQYLQISQRAMGKPFNTSCFHGKVVHC